VEIAREVGFEQRECASLLSSEAGAAEVKAEEMVGHKMGIRSVPHFILDGTYAISGAQPPEIFLPALQRIEGDRAGR